MTIGVGGAVALAFCAPALRDHVGHIFAMTAEKKMCRVYAPSVVAMMTNESLLIGRSVFKLPSVSVCADIFSPANNHTKDAVPA